MPKQNPETIPLTEVCRPLGDLRRRRAAAVTDSTRRRAAVAPAALLAAKPQVDVLVVEEVALVEEADVAEELGGQQDGSTGEELDVARRVEGGAVELVVADV